MNHPDSMPAMIPDVIGPVVAEPSDLGQQRLDLLLDPIGQRLDEPGSTERVDDRRDACLLQQDVLRPQRNLGRFLCRKGKDLVQSVGVQRVCTAKYGGKRLDRRADNVVLWLLRCERHPRRLGVEPQPLGSVSRGAVPFTHPAGPDPPRCAELGDLLEEVDVRVEEEAQPRSEVVHGKAT